MTEVIKFLKWTATKDRMSDIMNSWAASLEKKGTKLIIGLPELSCFRIFRNSNMSL